ncbi:MAG TPA: response regulator transcription factor [Roseiflexaceae bacterium]|nr:response regulator transcription factor [Roseiflexaceae bacterium]
MGLIVLIDSDVDLCQRVHATLEPEGYELLVTHDGISGLETVRATRPDLVILAVRLPGPDGFSVCRALRRENDVPVILLTEHADDEEGILGLDIGADDYVRKPFGSSELLARVRARLRRGARATQPGGLHEALLCDLLYVDVGGRRVFRGNLEIALVAKEFELLVCLMRHSGIVLSRDELFQCVWGEGRRRGSRTVDVHICWLRTKIEPDPSRPHYIQTVRGRGYRFAEGVHVYTPSRAAQIA